jgi:phosphate-selective porin
MKKLFLGLLISLCLVSNSFAEIKTANFSGFIQTLYQMDANASDQFDIPRARLKVKGKLEENVSFTLLMDAVSATSLWGAYIDISASEELKLKIGQFKTPFSYEYLTSSTKLDTIFLANAINTLTTKYDIGFQVYGQKNIFKYTLGLFNGAGKNANDANDNKEIIGNIRCQILPSTELGLAGGYGKDNVTNKSVKRLGGHLAFTLDKATIKAELINKNDANIIASGGYLQATYLLLPQHQAVLKYDIYEPDTSISGDQINALTLGHNWFISNTMKLSTNILLISEETNEINNNQFVTQFQILF